MEKSRIPNYRISHISETSMHEKTKRRIPGTKNNILLVSRWEPILHQVGSHVKQMIKSYTDFKGI